MNLNKLKKLSGDASFRNFYRGKNSIFIYCIKNKKSNLLYYDAINKILIKNKVIAPSLISQNYIDNYMEIEDFGDKTLLYHVKKSKNKIYFYKKCVDVIIKIQKYKPNKKIKLNSKKFLNLNKYNLRNLHKESNLFFDWYLSGVIGKKKSLKWKKIIRTELNKLYQKIFFKNQFIVHRDFHVSNIMPVNEKLGLIDTQDAILGNPMYDLVSLVDDVRFKVPSQIKDKTFKYYLKKCSIKNKQIYFLKNDFDILSIQRNLKILGIFYRLFKRDNKSQYLKYLPYTWYLIELRMKNKIFKNLQFLLKKAISQRIRKKTNFK